MGQRTAASTYAQTAIESAPPLKIIHMLYEGALRFMDQAASLDPKADRMKFSRVLNRADAIVSELRISIEPEHAPEIAENLTSLYVFVEDQIQEAMSQADASFLDPARTVLKTLLEAWKQLEVDGTGALPAQR